MTESGPFTRYLPNLATSLNLVAGSVSIVCSVEGSLNVAAWFIFIAVFFDFSDGFLARLLNAYSELGKQLDSLADVVSFGVAPALLLYHAFRLYFTGKYGVFSPADLLVYEKVLLFIPLLVIVASAFRLGKFNIDPDQKDRFLGLPTPACGIFIAAYLLIVLDPGNRAMTVYLLNPWSLLVLILLLSSLLVSRIPMFSLKFHHYHWKENSLRYVFIGISVILVILFRLYALPAIILFYVIVSTGYHLTGKNT